MNTVEKVPVPRLRLPIAGAHLDRQLLAQLRQRGGPGWRSLTAPERPFEARPIPAFGRLQDASDPVGVSILNEVNESWMSQEILGIAASEDIHEQAAIQLYRAHLVADFVHVGNKCDPACVNTGLGFTDVQDELSGRVSLGFRPIW